MTREDATLGIGDVLRGYPREGVSDNVCARFTMNSDKDKEMSVLSCSRTVQVERTHACAWAWRAALAQIQGVSLAEQVELRTALTMQSTWKDEHVSDVDTVDIGSSILLESK